MDKQEYFEKLKDPRWQKRRLDIFTRDDYECVSCGSKDKTLTVHHKYYDNNLEPWEYENDSLITLCIDCHEGEQGYSKLIHPWFNKEFKTKFSTYDLEVLTNALEKVKSKYTMSELAQIISEVFDNKKKQDYLFKHCDLYNWLDTAK